MTDATYVVTAKGSSREFKREEWDTLERYLLGLSVEPRLSRLGLLGVHVQVGSDQDNCRAASIAVGGPEWALLVTQMTGGFPVEEWRTKSARKRSGSVDVYWDQPTPIPNSWFIRSERVLHSLRGWLESGVRDPKVVWSTNVAS